jgi:hypothetical protein
LAIHLAQKGANLHLDDSNNSVLFKFFKNSNIEMMKVFYENDLIKFNEIPIEVLEEFKKNLLVEKEINPIVESFMSFINDMQIKEKEIAIEKKITDISLSGQKILVNTNPSQTHVNALSSYKIKSDKSDEEYLININERTCTCKSFYYSREYPQNCKHLIKVEQSESAMENENNNIIMAESEY